MERTKVALLGTGFISEIHIECYQRFVPEAEIVAVYSRDKERAKAFAGKHSIASVFTDIDSLLKE